MKFEKLKPGMTVFSVKRGNSIRGYKYDTWRVIIIEIDIEKRRVLASWNNNPNQWFSEKIATKWRLNNPNRKPKVKE